MFLATGWFIPWRRMPCFVFVSGFSPFSLFWLFVSGVKSELATLKRVLEKISGHENSVLHCTSLAQWKSFEYRLSTGKTIDAHLQEQLDRERERKHCKLLIASFLQHSFWSCKGFIFEAIVSKVTKIWWQRLVIVVITWNCLNWLQGTTPLWHPIWPARNLGASTLPCRFRMR